MLLPGAPVQSSENSCEGPPPSSHTSRARGEDIPDLYALRRASRGCVSVGTPHAGVVYGALAVCFPGVLHVQFGGDRGPHLLPAGVVVPPALPGLPRGPTYAREACIAARKAAEAAQSEAAPATSDAARDGAPPGAGAAAPDSPTVSPARQICFDFTKGLCTRGDHCKFSHSVEYIISVNSQEKGICFDFLKGMCSRGLLCRFSHDLTNLQAPQVRHRRSVAWKDGAAIGGGVPVWPSLCVSLCLSVLCGPAPEPLLTCFPQFRGTTRRLWMCGAASRPSVTTS